MLETEKSKKRASGLYRESKRMPAGPQIKALTAYGCGHVFSYEERAEWFGRIRQGDLIVVVREIVLGHTRAEVAATIAAILKRKADVYVIESQKHTATSLDATEIVLNAVSQLAGEGRALSHKEAERRGRLAWKRRKSTRMSEADAVAIWAEPGDASNEERLARMHGWSLSAVYRHPNMGKRGVLAGRPPKHLARHMAPREYKVYFLQNGSKREVKIGVTSGLSGRMNALSHPLMPKLKCLATIDGGFGLEKEMHKRFAKYRIKGEWFKLEGDLQKFVASLQAKANRK